MKEKVTCAERLREALDFRDIKQSELCEITGIPKSAMSQYVSGAFEPKQDRVESLAKALNVNEAWLMGYDVSIDRGGFGALDPALPFNMQGANLDGAKVDVKFLNYLISNLFQLYESKPNYIRTKNNILDLAESSGLKEIAAPLIKRFEQDMRSEFVFPELDNELVEDEKLTAEIDDELLMRLFRSDSEKIKLARWIMSLDVEELKRVNRLLDAALLLPKE